MDTTSATVATETAPRFRCGEAVRYIALHYSEPLTLALVAEAVDLSPTYFSALFAKAMGVTYQEYLAWVRIEEAKKRDHRKLGMPDMPISGSTAQYLDRQ